jgi:hypothetical protein
MLLRMRSVFAEAVCAATVRSVSATVILRKNRASGIPETSAVNRGAAQRAWARAQEGRIELWCGFIDVRYAPIATKSCIAAK